MIDIRKLYNNPSLKANYENISINLNKNSTEILSKNNELNNINFVYKELSTIKETEDEQ